MNSRTSLVALAVPFGAALVVSMGALFGCGSALVKNPTTSSTYTSTRGNVASARAAILREIRSHYGSASAPRIPAFSVELNANGHWEGKDGFTDPKGVEHKFDISMVPGNDGSWSVIFEVFDNQVPPPQSTP